MSGVSRSEYERRKIRECILNLVEKYEHPDADTIIEYIHTHSKVQMSRNSLLRYMKRLEQSGKIVITRGGKSTHYHCLYSLPGKPLPVIEHSKKRLGMRSLLVLVVKKKYFDQIKSGEKTEEYRLCNDYWNSMILPRKDELTMIEIRNGYTKNPEKILKFPWKGYEIRTIQHEEFGQDPVKVYAILLKAIS